MREEALTKPQFPPSNLPCQKSTRRCARSPQTARRRDEAMRTRTSPPNPPRTSCRTKIHRPRHREIFVCVDWTAVTHKIRDHHHLHKGTRIQLNHNLTMKSSIAILSLLAVGSHAFAPSLHRAVSSLLIPITFRTNIGVNGKTN